MIEELISIMFTARIIPPRPIVALLNGSHFTDKNILALSLALMQQIKRRDVILNNAGGFSDLLQVLRVKKKIKDFMYIQTGGTTGGHLPSVLK